MKLLVLTLFLLMVPFSAMAITASEVVVTTMISERMPVDSVEIYPAQQGKLYCFSRIEGAVADTSIEHVWLYQGREMARVTLPVRSAKWRTYSSKNIVAEWKGDWEVRVADLDGNALASAYFRVE